MSHAFRFRMDRGFLIARLAFGDGGWDFRSVGWFTASDIEQRDFNEYMEIFERSHVAYNSRAPSYGAPPPFMAHLEYRASSACVGGYVVVASVGLREQIPWIGAEIQMVCRVGGVEVIMRDLPMTREEIAESDAFIDVDLRDQIVFPVRICDGKMPAGFAQYNNCALTRDMIAWRLRWNM